MNDRMPKQAGEVALLNVGDGDTKQVATITIERFPTRRAAEQAERVAILAEKPLHNIAHAKPC